MISNINFGNTKETKKTQASQYPSSVYYYPTRQLSRDEVNISHSNNNQQQVYKPKKQFQKPSLGTMLAVASSSVMLLFFGGQLLAGAKNSKGLRKIQSAMTENAQKIARETAEKAGKSAEEIEKAVKKAGDFAGDNLEDLIAKCKDPILQKAAYNEYEKGPMIMSEKRIKDILSMANIKDTNPEAIDLSRAKKLLDEKIVGMDEAKEQILDYLIEQNYCIKNGIKREKPLVLCLDGPAGTGKTTISEVMAEAMDMHYKKISLAGATGKAPIKGSEAVYTGASMGGIAEGQIESGTRRVLYCLDEAEKAGSSDYNGRIQDTLLALFDDQAKFTDDNLNLPIDVSQSVFVLTTNEFDKLSDPLKNRVRKIQIAPYGVDIKSKIADLKLKKGLKKFKLGEDVVKVNADTCKTLAEMTTDQGGRETTRNVDKLIEKLVSKVELGENEGKVMELTPEFIKKELSEGSKNTGERIARYIAKQ